MEAVSIIGLAGSIINVVDVVTKSIKTLRKLQLQWQTADWTFTALLGQLSTLELALNQIKERIYFDINAEPQHQLLADGLCTSLNHYKTLISFLDFHISQLQWSKTSEIAFKSRVKAVLNDSRVKDCMMQLSYQSTALNLLLTALKR